MTSSRPSAAHDLIDSLLEDAPVYPPRVKASTTPRLATPIDRSNPSQRSGTTTSALRACPMTSTVGPRDDSRNCEKPVQRVQAPYIRKVRTRVQLEALEALGTLAEPFSIASAARDLGWDISESKYWIMQLSARGYLIASRDGHRWTKHGRSA